METQFQHLTMTQHNYLLKLTICDVSSIKRPPSASMACLEFFTFNPSSVNISLPKIMSYLPLLESSTLHFHVTTLVALSAGKVKSTLTLKLVVILLPVFALHHIIFYQIQFFK